MMGLQAISFGFILDQERKTTNGDGLQKKEFQTFKSQKKEDHEGVFIAAAG